MAVTSFSPWGISTNNPLFASPFAANPIGSPVSQFVPQQLQQLQQLTYAGHQQLQQVQQTLVAVAQQIQQLQQIVQTLPYQSQPTAFAGSPMSNGPWSASPSQFAQPGQVM